MSSILSGQLLYNPEHQNLLNGDDYFMAGGAVKIMRAENESLYQNRI